MGQQIDAHAEGFELRSGFVDAAGNPELVKPQPECKAADTRTCDDDFHDHLMFAMPSADWRQEELC